MTTLACCFVDDETPYCEHRRFETLPMCKKHITAVMRTAILDALMPWDAMREIVKYTEQAIVLRQAAERFGWKRQSQQTAADRAAMADNARRKLGVVYYVSLPDNRIKIGRTINLKTRMNAMRVRKHQVLAAEPGGNGVEADRHHEFKHIRHGKLEEFDATPELMDHIRSIRDQWGDPWTLDVE